MEGSIRFNVLYSTQLRRKNKMWCDGKATYNPRKCRLSLTDERGNAICSHWVYRQPRIGEEIAMESAIVQIEYLVDEMTPSQPVISRTTPVKKGFVATSMSSLLNYKPQLVPASEYMAEVHDIRESSPCVVEEPVQHTVDLATSLPQSRSSGEGPVGSAESPVAPIPDEQGIASSSFDPQKEASAATPAAPTKSLSDLLGPAHQVQGLQHTAESVAALRANRNSMSMSNCEVIYSKKKSVNWMEKIPSECPSAGPWTWEAYWLVGYQPMPAVKQESL